MRSPFPGMDPYLENPAHWQDFHGELTYAIRHQLLGILPDEYDASVNKAVRLVERVPSDDEAESAATSRDRLPDVAVTRDASVPPAPARPGPAGTGAALLEPVAIAVPELEEVVERWIEILYRPDDSLVTAVEVLSPTNKTGDGYGAYQLKRQDLLRQRVNLVELDLLVGGRRTERSGKLPVGDYYAIVGRAGESRRRLAYAWSVRRTLPGIPIPLRRPDPDVPLDLAAAFAEAYDRGRYGKRLKYRTPPDAPLSADDVAWASEVATQFVRD